MTDDNTLLWSGYEWLNRERWGRLHERKPFVWYDPNAVEIDNNGYLHLSTRKNPAKFFTLDTGKPIYSDNGVGLVSCKEKFSYGTFEIEAKLPTGKYAWAAFWMWSWTDCPPEIDVLESYADENKSYFAPFKYPFWNIYNVQSTIHYKIDDKHMHTSGKKGFLYKNPAKNFIKYRLEWQPESIKIYYDNILVRKITNKRILQALQGHKMNVIINNSLTQNGNDINSDFIVKYFKFEQLK